MAGRGGGDKFSRVLERLGRTGHAVRCGEGWFAIVEQLDRALAELDPDYFLFRVARTGGVLVFDAEPSTPPLAGCFSELIDAASARASATCEVCGAAGELRTVRGLVEVLCAVHWPVAEAAGGGAWRRLTG